MSLKRVLLIDDDPLFLLVAGEMLNAIGAERVDTACDGADGLRILAEAGDDFDLILCDLNMPQIDGISVVRALSERRFDGRFAVVSGESSDIVRAVKDMASLVGINMIGALSKPLREEDLRAMLERRTGADRRASAGPVSRAELLTEMASGHLVPVYQPKLQLDGFRLNSVEVLSRWRAGDGALRSAQTYLAAAELHGLMTKYTLALMERSLMEISKLASLGIKVDPAFNISPSSLRERSFPDAITQKCRSAGMDPRRVTLEITEDRLLEFHADVLEVLTRLRVAGFHLSVDDFGAGTTNMQQLRRFPLTELKIDRYYVQNADRDAFAHETMMSSVRLARLLGLRTVAEGIETAEDVRTAKAAEIDVLQGYLISKPVPAERLIQVLREPAGKAAAA